MDTETLLEHLRRSREALVDSQRAIDAILLQQSKMGTAEQSAMGRISTSAVSGYKGLLAIAATIHIWHIKWFMRMFLLTFLDQAGAVRKN